LTMQTYKDRNWRLERYSREEKLQIIRHQLYAAYSGRRTAKYDRRVLIAQAATLTLLIYDMEKEFTDTGEMNKSYLSHVNTYNRILFKLGAKPKKDTQEKGPNLEAIIND